MKQCYLKKYRTALNNSNLLDGSKEDTKKIKKILDKVYEEINKSIENNFDEDNRINYVLMSNYCMYISMIEYRNKVWKYTYMDFSRRIGELWEPFCKLCWEYPLNDELSIMKPIEFEKAKSKIINKFESTIKNFNLNDSQLKIIKKNNDNLWDVITSGTVNLKSDLHFSIGDKNYNLDFKSGFNSNEKGNVNRLLLVGKIYNLIDANYNNYILVRSESDRNNHYLKTLENSGIWEVYAGLDSYDKIKEITGVDLKVWIDENINWLDDLNEETREYLVENELDEYLLW